MQVSFVKYRPVWGEQHKDHDVAFEAPLTKYIFYKMKVISICTS